MTGRKTIGLLAVSMLIGVGSAIGQEANWDAAINASNPLNWYKLDEAQGTVCSDSGSGGLNGTYTNVSLGQDGVFGAGSAVEFDGGLGSVIQFGGTNLTDDYTVEYLVMKNGTANQALHDGSSTSIRIQGWDTQNVGFTQYGVADYYFTVQPGQTHSAPIGKWIHFVIRRNSEGIQAFINGILVGTQTNTVDLPRDRISKATGDQFYGLLDEAVVYDRALDDTEIAAHAAIAAPWLDLAYDDFEGYQDTAAMAMLWNSDGTIMLETSETHKGMQSMKAEVAAGDTIKKTIVASMSDYISDAGKKLVVWIKGDAGNEAGDIMLSVLDPNDNPVSSTTSMGVIQQDEWTEIVLAVPNASDPNLAWVNIASIQIEVTGGGTIYVDDLGIVVPKARKVVEWLFNESSGAVAVDSSGNDIDGVLNGGFGDSNWIIGGGRTGEPDDNAILFDGDATKSITALNIDLSQLDVEDIFKGDSSWSMNIWVKIEADPGTTMIAGFGDCVFVDGSGYNDRYFNFWTGGSVEFNYGENGMWPGTEPSLGEWHMLTVTYDKWSRQFTMYLDAYVISSENDTLIDVTENSIKIGTGVVAWEDAANQPPLTAMIDDFSIFDGVLPMTDDDDDPTNDILSMYAGWVCTNPPAYDTNGDCIIDIADLAAFLDAWLDSGRYPEGL
ncbi:MAG: laminin G domain-containing protein [Sedimentisphaerales bacterium]|nr:laminin G domain-containing protein [Sedimentisphaerales bacterium]